jgi:hypothetical protein
MTVCVYDCVGKYVHLCMERSSISQSRDFLATTGSFSDRAPKGSPNEGPDYTTRLPACRHMDVARCPKRPDAPDPAAPGAPGRRARGCEEVVEA